MKLLLIFFFFTIAAYAQNTHPHILVKPQDKQKVLAKISQQEWAKKSFDDLVKNVEPYVERHKTDPQWILSRYLMNRVPGKRYTKFYSDEDGSALTKYEGDASFPTIRVSSNKRPPITEDGYGYKLPSIEEQVPYDTSMKMLLTVNKPGGKQEWADPQTFAETLNGRINQLALDAAIIYWLNGKEEYAKFAADILDQWAHGASLQEPIIGPCRTGFLSIQTLGDGKYEPMPLAYDFVYDYMRVKKYETSWYEKVFDRIANTMTFRGYWNNNWFAAQTPQMVFCALSLENKKQRDYYLNFYLNKDTISGACGHLAIPSVISKWLTPDGHWKEPGGYHNFPISSLLISALAMENNGYNVFGKYPALLQSSYVLLKYSFPNFMAPSIGDTGPVSQSSECLEIGILMAKKYGNKIADQLTAAMDVMIQQKGYKRESSDYLGLLCYLPEIPSRPEITYKWPRSGELDFAKCYLQRNGVNKETGLMYLVQGASYNHNHANGMSLELYGAGMVMGIDPGKGITYEAPMHVNYYAQWAAHNTVVAGGVSSSVPYFRGGGGTKQMGEIKLETMEPMAENRGVSPYCSFTDTRYTDMSTKAKQQRTLAIIRTSETSGYYVDIYRSDHPKSNEYIYHNIGNDIKLLDNERKALQLTNDSFPYSTQPFDPPGFRNIKEYQSTGKTDKDIIALFTVKAAGEKNKYMQVLFAGEEGREFFSGKAPPSGTADIPYRSMPTPVIIGRQEGEAWKRPFVAVYEPFIGDNNFSVEKLEAEAGSENGEFTAIKVSNKDKSQQIIFQNMDAKIAQQKNDWIFKGNFGIIGMVDMQLKYLYIGSGQQLSYQQYSIETGSDKGSANIRINGNKLLVSCNQPVTIRIKKQDIKSGKTFTENGKAIGGFVKTKEGVEIKLPAIINAEINLN